MPAMRYFITFACYGAHLHGSETGSVDRNHNVPDRDRRTGVLDALREVCVHSNWSLLAAHVRSNHVHAVVEADISPDKVMNAFKWYASRRLNQLGSHDPGRK